MCVLLPSVNFDEKKLICRRLNVRLVLLGLELA